VRTQPIEVYDTDADEAYGVVMSLMHARSPRSSWSSIAVLARTNAQLLLFEREFDAAGIPFRSGSGRAFLASPTVRRALDRLRSPVTAAGFSVWMEELAEAGCGLLTPVGYDSGECIDDDLPSPSPAEALSANDDELVELSKLAVEYLRSDSRPTADGFVSWLEASLLSDPPVRRATPST
jgi:hypothetical protein